MPEELEINAQKKELVNKHKIEGCTITSIKNMRKREKSQNFTVFNELEKLLPLKIDKVLTRGKELAFTFTNGFKLVFGMGTGGYFAVDDQSKLEEFPFKDRTNFCMVTSTGKTVFVLECNSSQNQITLALKKKDEETFDMLRGPDLIDASVADLLANLNDFLYSDSKLIQNYFEKATLLDACHNQSLFNGLGAYTTAEVLHWLWILKGIRPWENAASFLENDANQRLLINIIKTYFQVMLDYLKPGTEKSKIDCNSFNERMWLDFRGIFVRCYRNYLAEDRDGAPQKVSKYSKGLIHCKEFKITKPKGNLFLVNLTEDELDLLKNDGWVKKATQPFSKHSLGVGMHNWWGPKERKDALESPIKANQMLVELRPSTKEDLLKSQGVKRKLDDISSCEEDLDIEPEAKKQKTGKPKKKRPNKRRRWILNLHNKMKLLIKTD